MVTREYRPEPERYARQGFPEAIYGQGKTTGQIVRIAAEMRDSDGPVMVTRAGADVFRAVRRKFPEARYYRTAGIVLVDPGKAVPVSGGSYVCVITAGTSDVPVAEEAAVTAEILGNRVERLYDVGVSGIHRLLEHRSRIVDASCAVVCAGMEGALASVVGGMAPCPVIGVPTSVGYGVSQGGMTALYTMLNSCAPNVVAVNIDDGFGAGVTAGIINRRR